MMKCFHICFNFAFKFNLRRYITETTGTTAEPSFGEMYGRITIGGELPCGDAACTDNLRNNWGLVGRCRLTR